MRKELKDIIDALPEKPPRSRLTPYAELIDEMRERGWTFRAIAGVLAEKCGVRTSPSNLHHFVRIDREKMRRLPVQVGRPTSATETNQRITPLKQPPLSSESIETGFQFDPDEPLRLEKAGAKRGDKQLGSFEPANYK